MDGKKTKNKKEGPCLFKQLSIMVHDVNGKIEVKGVKSKT